MLVKTGTTPIPRTPKFPSRIRFWLWWLGKTDVRDDKATPFVSASCPFARYLRAHGWPYAEVSSYCWFERGASFQPEGRPLPTWARIKVRKFDSDYARRH
jgi:hypothetical protein